MWKSTNPSAFFLFFSSSSPTPQQISRSAEHGSKWKLSGCTLRFLFSVGGAWLSTASTQSIAFVVCVYTSWFLTEKNGGRKKIWRSIVVTNVGHTSKIWLPAGGGGGGGGNGHDLFLQMCVIVLFGVSSDTAVLQTTPYIRTLAIDISSLVSGAARVAGQAKRPCIHSYKYICSSRRRAGNPESFEVSTYTRPRQGVFYLVDMYGIGGSSKP